MTVTFARCILVQDVEESQTLAPHFPMDVLMLCVTSDAGDGAVLMIGWMNAEALGLTIVTVKAHYFSRIRQQVWHKEVTSAMIQRVGDMRIDDHKGALCQAVEVAGSGASYHVGYWPCFYRATSFSADAGRRLQFTESQRRFDPVSAYGDAPDATVL